MPINPYLFILARSPSLVVWDYKNHKQFELNSEYATRLVQLIETPTDFNSNHSVDANLLNSGIITTTEEHPIEWGWDDLSKIFHIGTKNIPCEHIPNDIHEGSAQYLIHCYLYVRNVSGLKAGIYYYHPDLHALRSINSLPEEPLGLLLAGQHFINLLPFGLFITCRFDKLWWKYEHSRAYRMAFVEAGHISQTFQLVATGLGLNTWLTGALTDDRVEALLGLESSAEQPLMFVGCGHGDGQVQCKELNALINDQDAG
jgi:SagB-type dehydrogenase family enzyme